MSRGGKRQGTPGKAYSNRTDLAVNTGPQTGMATAASGGVAAPAPQQWTTPDQVPSLTDPTARPDLPVTHGLATGPGAGMEAIGPVPSRPEADQLFAAYAIMPTPELMNAIMMMQEKGVV